MAGRSVALVTDRFWAKVEKTESCWLWRGALGRFGYGAFHQTRGERKAHRVAWQLTNGAIPQGMCVLHRCDVPACVNPDHLFLGTYADNNADMKSKGRDRKRGIRGPRNNSARLTESDVLSIYESREPSRAVGKKYGVSKTTVLHIRSGRTWGYLSGLKIERLTEAGWKVGGLR